MSDAFLDQALRYLDPATSEAEAFRMLKYDEVYLFTGDDASATIDQIVAAAPFYDRGIFENLFLAGRVLERGQSALLSSSFFFLNLNLSIDTWASKSDLYSTFRYWLYPRSNPTFLVFAGDQTTNLSLRSQIAFQKALCSVFSFPVRMVFGWTFNEHTARNRLRLIAALLSAWSTQTFSAPLAALGLAHAPALMTAARTGRGQKAAMKALSDSINAMRIPGASGITMRNLTSNLFRIVEQNVRSSLEQETVNSFFEWQVIFLVSQNATLLDLVSFMNHQLRTVEAELGYKDRMPHPFQNVLLETSSEGTSSP